MRIGVFGAGGVGGYFGGRLAQSGEEVVFIARGEHLHALRSSGLHVKSIKGDFSVDRIDATDDPTKVKPVDAILVAVKAWQVPDAVKSMSPMVGPRTIILPLENGVGAPDQISQQFGPERAIGGLCKISSYLAAPGHICHAGIEPYIALGRLDNVLDDRVEHLKKLFEKAGILIEVPQDIHVEMWKKFLFIASFGGIGAVTRAPVGVFRSPTGLRGMLVQAMEEIAVVGRAKRIALPEDIVESTMDFIDGMDGRITASMQRDILEGRPSELESQSGAVVRMGKEVNKPTPMHGFIYNALLPREMKARGEIQW